MSDCFRVYRRRIQPSHSGQLSLAIPPWVGKIGTGDCGVRREWATMLSGCVSK